MASIYFKKPVTFADAELRLRLPVDETSFELGVHSTLPGMFPASTLDFPFCTSPCYTTAPESHPMLIPCARF